MTRPTKLTPARQKAIVEAIEQGATYEHAAAAAGVAHSTLSDWRKRNPTFSEALKVAEARGVLACLKRIEQAAASGQWQAAAWILERRYPDTYGRRERMDVKHAGTLDITMLASLRAAILAAVEDVPTRVRIAEALMALDGAEAEDDGGGSHE